MQINLIAVDAHPVYLLGLKHLFSTQSNFMLLACCADYEKTFEAIDQQRPDILVIDPKIAAHAPLDLIRKLKETYEEMKVIILTDELDDEQTITSLRLRVEGIILKNMPMHLLIQCINKVASGGQWLEKNSLSLAFEKMLSREAGARRLATILTVREIEVMSLVAQGLNNRQIADKLILSVGTVKIHVHNIYEKLGIKNRVDLTLYAQKRGVA